MGLLITLMLLGLILVLAEIFIIPGLGIAGIAGIVSMGGSAYYAFTEFGNTTGYIMVGVAGVLLIILMLISLRTKTWEKMSLKTNIDSKALKDEAAIVQKGDIGRTVTRLAPMGTARFGYYSTEVKALDGMIDPGVDVEIVLIEDNKIYVTPVIRSNNN